MFREKHHLYAPTQYSCHSIRFRLLCTFMSKGLMRLGLLHLDLETAFWGSQLAEKWSDLIG